MVASAAVAPNTAVRFRDDTRGKRLKDQIVDLESGAINTSNKVTDVGAATRDNVHFGFQAPSCHSHGIAYAVLTVEGVASREDVNDFPVVVDRLNREINAAVAIPEVRQRLQDLGIDARGSTPEGFRELLVADIAKWKTVIEKAKIPRQ